MYFKITKGMGVFARHQQGSFATIFALSLLLIMIAAGVALDMFAMHSKKQTLQDALDAAVLSSLYGQDATEGQDILRRIFASNSIDGEILEFSIEKSDDISKSAAKIRFDYPLNFAGILGATTKPIVVTARAEGPNGPSSLKINIVSAKGDYNKVFKLIVSGKSGESEKINAVYKKDPKVFKISNKGWVDLGEYEKVYFDFIVSTCGKSCDVHFRSDDPNEAHRLTVDGKRQPSGEAADIVKLVKCGKSARHDWEDGGGGSPDFTYNIEAICNGDFVGPARLTK